MAKQQAAAKNQPTVGRGASKSDVAPRGDAQTGASDDTYNLISVMYHCLQGAETTQKYLADTRQSENTEIRAFFQRVSEQYAEFAAQGKELLADQLAGDEDEDFDEEDEEEDDEP